MGRYQKFGLSHDHQIASIAVTGTGNVHIRHSHNFDPALGTSLHRRIIQATVIPFDGTFLILGGVTENQDQTNRQNLDTMYKVQSGISFMVFSSMTLFKI